MSDYFQRAEKAIQYLGESEEEFARYKALHQAMKEQMKIVKAGLIMDSAESSQGMKEKWAESHPDFQKITDEWAEAMEQFYLIEAKRTRAELTIEMYRSVNSALKRGNI